MAQLSDDCFAFGGELLGVDAALALIRSGSRRLSRLRPCRLPLLPGAFWLRI